MKLHYYPDTDSLYIDLAARPSMDSIEVASHVVVDLDEGGQITGIDIQHASRVVDLSAVSVAELPFEAAPVAVDDANAVTAGRGERR